MNPVHTNDCLSPLWYSLVSSITFTKFILKGNTYGHMSGKQDLNCIHASHFIFNLSVVSKLISNYVYYRNFKTFTLQLQKT